MSEEETLEQVEPVAVRDEVKRESGIGSSEISSILGLDPYRSPYDTWLIKTGRVSSDVDNEPMYWGRRLQKTIVEEYERRRGVALVHMFDEPVRNAERAWQIASPDATLPSDKLVVEAKNTRYGKKYGPAGTDEVPETHRLQVAWQLSTLDYERGHIAALIGGSDFRVYEFQRDRELEDAMLSAAEKWWRRHVMEDTPPEVTDSEMTRDYLRKMFPKELAPLRKATEEEIVLARHYAAALHQQTRAEKVVGNLDVKIRAAIGADEGLEYDDFRLTYRKAKDAQKTDWKGVAGTYRAALQLIASGIGDTAKYASTTLETEKMFTTTAPGSRRLLKSGVIFNGEEE